jgi:hypothetical protein
MQARLEGWKVQTKSIMEADDIQKDADYILLYLKFKNINLKEFNKIYNTYKKPIDYKQERIPVIAPVYCPESCPDFACTKNHECVELSQELEYLTQELTIIADTERYKVLNDLIHGLQG